jgi:hypothetical protein
MALPSCPDCGSVDLDLREVLPDTRRHLVCGECDHDWLYGEAAVAPDPVDSLARARGRFPTLDAVPSATRERSIELKARFLAEHPAPGEAVAQYWAKYQQVFSAEGLPGCDPKDLKDFANTTTGANPGNMSVFNTAWNELGAPAAADSVRAAVDYLLRGPESIPEEDRLTHLIRGDRGLGMKGFRESLLTKVLCIVHPDRFLPILVYTGLAGKREIAEKVFGLRMPAPESISWTPGRLSYWSNDLLRGLAGDGFVDTVHVAEFLWWAKDRVSNGA